MKLILVRHAKAVTREVDMELLRHGKITGMDLDIDDSLRELTEEGINEFIESINSISNLLSHLKKPIIWSSSLVRADQTARIIGEALGIKDISYFNFLANGDFNEFKNELLSQDKDSTIIAVGHQPYLSDWVSSLLKEDMEFKKGQIVSIKLEVENLEDGALEWVKLPNKQIKYYEIPTIKKGAFSHDLKEVAAYYIQRILIMRENFIKNPADTLAAHQFRVSIRSLRSIISFIKVYFDTDKYEEYQDILRKMAQKFLYIRQFDVIIGEWEDILQENQEYLWNRNVLHQLLKDERFKEEKLVYEWMINEDISMVLSQILSWVRAFDDGLEPEEVENYFEKRLNKNINRVNRGIDSVDYSQLKEVHALRIKCKKARYILENLENTKKNIRLAKKYKSLQDDLGLICDTMVNKSFLDKLVLNNKIDGLEYEVGIFIGYEIKQASNVVARLQITT